MPRVELVDPDTAPPATKDAYDEIRELAACLARTRPVQAEVR